MIRETRMWLIWTIVALGLVFGGWVGFRRLHVRAIFHMMQSSRTKDRVEAVGYVARLALHRRANAFEALDRATADPDEQVRKTAGRWINELGERLGRLPLTPI